MLTIPSRDLRAGTLWGTCLIAMPAPRLHMTPLQGAQIGMALAVALQVLQPTPLRALLGVALATALPLQNPVAAAVVRSASSLPPLP